MARSERRSRFPEGMTERKAKAAGLGSGSNRGAGLAHPYNLDMDTRMNDVSEHDVLVIGAGPTGLACAIAAQRAGLRVILADKGCLTNSLFHYPAHMTFFTTPELLEIGDMPFSSPNQKPTRSEALEYYRKVAEHYELDVRQY